LNVEDLRPAFRQEELELAAAIGSQGSPLRDRVAELFRQLPDPLLSASDVGFLLRNGEPGAEIERILGNLCEERVLECSTNTLRPLDPDGIKLYRLAGVPFARLKVLGLEARLADGDVRYQFTCDGRIIRSIARVDRLDSLAGTGNQRSEIINHVRNIADGIRGGTQVPNSILLVLDASHVADDEETSPESFISVRPLAEYTKVPHPTEGTSVIQEIRPVEIEIPFRRAAFDEEKSAILVDGQQRTAALSLVDIDDVPSFALSVNAVIADEDDAKKIFFVANSTVKIETQFSRALLASMDQSPGFLFKERPRAIAAKQLALDDEDSPFFDLVQYPGRKTQRRRAIAYNSLFQVLTAFAESGLPIQDDAKLLAKVTKRSFNLVKKTWPSAWGERPSVSKLMHGAGLRSIANLLVTKLEAVYPVHGDFNSEELWREVELSLKRLQPHLLWRVADTENALKGAVKTYNEQIAPRQNTSQDISALSAFIRRMSLDFDTDANKAQKK